MTATAARATCASFSHCVRAAESRKSPQNSDFYGHRTTYSEKAHCIKDSVLLEEKGSECTAPTINEETLQTAVVRAINELLANKEPFLSTLQKNIDTIFNEESDNDTDELDSKLEELQIELLKQAKSKNDYDNVADEIYRLREMKQNSLVENAEREGKRQRIAEMTAFLNEQSHELEEYDEQLVRRLIEKVTIRDDRIEVEFKSGVKIEEMI